MVHAKLLQSCPTLCDPIDCSSPGSSVHGILQARILGWVAMSSSRGSSRPRDGTCVSYVSRQVGSLPLVLPGKLYTMVETKQSLSREGTGTPLQCSCLENPRDGGAWRAAVYGVAQSRPRLKRLSRSSSSMQLSNLSN